MKLRYIKYRYIDYGDISNCFTYKLYFDEGAYHLEITSESYLEYEICKVTLKDEELKDILKVIDDYDVYSWNNFHRSVKGNDDGYGFSFIMKSDLNDIEASGINCVPSNFHEVHASLQKILGKYKTEYDLNRVD